MKPTTPLKKLLLCFIAAAVPASMVAQTVTNDPLSFRRAGEREFTLGGAGATNPDMNNSFGGVNFSYGWYATENAAWVIRQSINYSNPRVGPTTWGGATRVAYDYHLAPQGALRPFVGANFGGAYGDAIRDTFAAGLEGGVKFYVQPRTFVYTMAEYGWFFRRASGIDRGFKDGQINWSMGLGFNF
jgi:hypothetical protein